MSKAEDDLKKEGAQELANRQAKKENKLLAKLKGRAERDARKAQEEANVVQLSVGLATAGIGVAGGYKLNQKLRSYTADWLDEEGNRTMGATILADVTPPAVGLTVAGVGLFAIKNGVAAAAVAGAGTGVAIGSVVSTVFGVPAAA